MSAYFIKICGIVGMFRIYENVWALYSEMSIDLDILILRNPKQEYSMK